MINHTIILKVSHADILGNDITIDDRDTVSYILQTLARDIRPGCEHRIHLVIEKTAMRKITFDFQLRHLFLRNDGSLFITNQVEVDA